MSVLFLDALAALVHTVGDIQPYYVRCQTYEEYSEQQNEHDRYDYRADLAYRAKEQIADGTAYRPAAAEPLSVSVKGGYVKAAALGHIRAALAEKCGEKCDKEKSKDHLVPYGLVLSVLLPEEGTDEQQQGYEIASSRK